MFTYLLLIKDDLSWLHLILRGAWILILIYLARECILVARQEKANAKCGLSLAFVFIALILSNTSKFIESPFNFILIGLGGLMLLLSLFLAVTGLIELRHEKTEKIRGKAHAAWAIVFACCILTWWSCVLYRGLSETSSSRLSLSENAQEGEYVNREEYNFYFIMPPRPWKQLDAKKVNPDCCLALKCSDPDMMFMVVAENDWLEADLTLDALQSYILAKAGMNSKTHRLLEETPFSIDGLKGRLLTRRATVHDKDYYYKHWLSIQRGSIYQIVVWGLYKNSALISEEALSLFERFKTINPNYIPENDNSEYTSNYESPQFGYKIRLEDSPWSYWSGFTVCNRYAEIGLKCDYGYLLIVPVFLMGHDLSLEELTPALLKTVNLSLDESDLIELDEFEEGDIAGKHFSCFNNTEDRDSKYRLKIIKGKGFAYLLAGWVTKKDEDKINYIEGIMNRFTLPLKIAPPDLASLDFRKKRTQAYIMNQVGLVYYGKRKYDKSIPFFKLAYFFRPNDALFISNTMGAYNKEQGYEEALRYLDKYMALQDFVWVTRAG